MQVQSEIEGRAKVFVSYSRKDVDFADQLVLALTERGFDPLLDRHDIDVSENWRERLNGLIASSDSVVFVLTENSAGSPICRWEVERAGQLHKRLLVALPQSLDKAVEAPIQLSEINWIHFYHDRTVPGSGFYSGVQKLDRGLRVDLEWLRAQTRFSDQAREWSVSQGEDLLLRGKQLEVGRTWLSSAPNGAQIPREIIQFLNASEEAQERRRLEDEAQLAEREAAVHARDAAVQKLSRRTALGLWGAGALFLGAGGLAYWGNSAERRFNQERELRRKADAESVITAARSEGLRPGLAGQLLAFASAESKAATTDGGALGSPFSRGILQALQPGAVSLQAALQRGARIALEETDFRQRPYFQSDLSGEVYFDFAPPNRRSLALLISSDGANVGNLFRGPDEDFRVWKAFLEKHPIEVKTLKNPASGDVRSALADWNEQLPQSTGRGLRPVPVRAERFLLVVYSGPGLTMGNDQYIPLGNYEGGLDQGSLMYEALRISELVSIAGAVAKATALVLDTGFPELSWGTR